MTNPKETTKTSSQTFIGLAVTGEWKPNPKCDVVVRGNKLKVYYNDADDTKEFVEIEKLLLDPKAWQAVGKAKGWNKEVKSIWHMSTGPKTGLMEGNSYSANSWLHNLHRFIDHLANGLTIEAALERTLNQ